MKSTDTIEHILGMLDAVGLTTDDLIAHRATTNPQSAGVTLADYVSDVRRSLTKNTDGSYATHFGHLINGVSRQCSCTCARCLDDWVRQATCTCHCKECAKALSFGAMGNTVIAPRAFTQREIEPLVHIVERMATKRAMVENAIRAKRGLSPKPTHGQGAREMCVTALRHLFCKMVQDELIPSNPAENISKGRRSTSKRRAISDRELEELLEVVATGGDDPLLDLAISWAEFELGARRGGLLRMNVGHLDTTGQLISLWEKGNLFRQQPCSLDLINFLSRLAINRGGPACEPGRADYDPNAPVFYFRNSTASNPHRLTDRRFDTLHRRVQLALPWANSISYSGHILRHTIGTIVERIAGFETAKAMLGHSGGTPTDAYAKAELPEVARVISDITGKFHPLVTVG